MALTRDLRAATFAIGVGVVMLAGNAQAQPDRYDALANSAMTENRPTPETAKLLRDELRFQRATHLLVGTTADQHARHEGSTCPTAGSFFRAATRSP
jgi:hypothetical protein